MEPDDMSSSHSAAFFESVSNVDLATCVGCGLCLPHCPTFRVTGEDAFSPRGRIELIKSVKNGELNFDAEVEHALSTCIQCRGCEPACPSGVPYGRIIEHALGRTAPKSRVKRLGLSVGLSSLTKPRILRLVVKVGYVAQKMRIMPKSLPLPVLSFRRPRLHLRGAQSGREVTLFTGCVMDVAYRPVHQASITVLESLGYSVSTSESMGSCCGALHEHTGHVAAAQRIQKRLRRNSKNTTIVVNSAGCGASLKTSLVDVTEVLDIHELLGRHLGELSQLLVALKHTVVVQDPCHLRHVQKSHRVVHELLKLCYDVIEIPDDGLCCGAGGAFSIIEPKMALQVRARKEQAIRAAVNLNETWSVASANPGCLGFLAQTGLVVEHPIVLLCNALTTSNIQHAALNAHTEITSL